MCTFSLITDQVLRLESKYDSFHSVENVEYLNLNFGIIVGRKVKPYCIVLQCNSFYSSFVVATLLDMGFHWLWKLRLVVSFL